MDKKIMNEKIDILFKQIEDLKGEQRTTAKFAVRLWDNAKMCEFMGLGPMEARQDYKAAHKMFEKLELETGGMVPPYESLQGSKALVRVSSPAPVVSV